MRKFLTLAALAASVVAWGAVSVPVASAVPITVTLSGSQPGRVVSTSPGIDCSNIPGQEKTDCTADFVNNQKPIELTATAGPNAAFQTWSSAFSGGTCASGVTNPCRTSNPLYWFFPVTVDAKFGTKPTPPSVVSGEAPTVTFPSAKLHGEVNPNSDAFAVADCRFEYGETTAYGRFRSCQPDLGTGTSPVPVSATIGVLEPDTTYHYRLVASNGGGRTEGEDRTLTTGPAPADSCPNAKVRAQQGAIARVLPDCMAYELVTPPFTAGARASIVQIREDANATIFHTAGGIAGTPNLPDTGVTYRADRTDKGWATVATAPPAADYPFIGTSGRVDTSKDLRRSLWQANLKVDEGTQLWTPILGEARGPFAQVGPTLPIGAPHPAVVGTSADLGTVVSSTDHTRDAQNDGTVDSRMPQAGTTSLLASTRNADGQLRVRQVAYRAGATMFPGCNAMLGGLYTARASVSADGDKVFFTAGAEGGCEFQPEHHRVWAKVGGADPIDLSASRCDDGDCGLPEVADFRGASRDGSRVYFNSEEKLVNGDVKSDEGASTADNDLYEYDFDATGQKLRSVTASLDADGADFMTVARISDDGSHVYFVAKGRPLAGANARGAEPQPGEPNLYVYRRAAGQATGSTAFIATLDGVADAELMYPFMNRHSAATSSSGRFLVFLSAANLTGDKQAGDAFRDLFRYDSQTDELRRIWSKDPARNGGNRIAGPNEYWAPQENAGSQGAMQLEWDGRRTVSDDGTTIAFDTAEPLSPWDGNREPDVYMWKAGTGRFTLLTEGRPTRPGAISESSSYSGMSPMGDSLFFTTDTPVEKSHTSTQIASFVVRRGGGFLDDPVTPVCAADACQGPGAPAPGAPAIETGKDAGTGPVTPAEPPAGKLISVVVPKSVRGTQATLKVKVSAKGYVTTGGSAVRAGSRSVKKAGTHAVAVRLTASAAKTLTRKKQVRAKVKVTFRPEGGTEVSRTVTVTFKQAAAKKRAAKAKTGSVAKGGR
jgi:hypothetical protein